MLFGIGNRSLVRDDALPKGESGTERGALSTVPAAHASFGWEHCLLVPSILAAIAALKFCSALAVYWTVSNSYSALQTGLMHYVAAKRIKSGAVSI